MDEIDPDPTPAGWSSIFSPMEVLTSNEPNAVEEGVKFNLSGIGITSDLENMALESILNSSCAESIGAPIILDNEESMKVNMKRKTFEGVENGSQSPLKKLNSGPSPDALNANLDSSLDNLSSANTTEAMIIDTPSLVTGDRYVDYSPSCRYVVDISICEEANLINMQRNFYHPTLTYLRGNLLL